NGNRDSRGTLQQPEQQPPQACQQCSTDCQFRAGLPEGPIAAGAAQVDGTVKRNSRGRRGQTHSQAPRDPTWYVPESRDQFATEDHRDDDCQKPVESVRGGP